MRTKPLHHPIFRLTVLLLSLLLLAACSSPASKEPEAPAEPAIQEAAQPEAPAQAAAPSEGEVQLDDLIYPGAEFLFEIPGFGGPMVPWRFYAIPNTNTEQVAAFYSERLPWFNSEYDEVVAGHRNLMLAHPNPMAQLNNVDGEDELIAVSSELDGTLLGVEISQSSAHANLNRLGIAIEAYEHADEIPADTTILVLEYFSNPY